MLHKIKNLANLFAEYVPIEIEPYICLINKNYTFSTRVRSVHHWYKRFRKCRIE